MRSKKCANAEGMENFYYLWKMLIEIIIPRIPYNERRKIHKHLSEILSCDDNLTNAQYDTLHDVIWSSSWKLPLFSREHPSWTDGEER